MSLKLIVEIDCKNHTLANFEAHKADWFPMGPEMVSVDWQYLKIDPTDDSFYVFKFIEARES